jgi:prepilin-type processing-associated H-X9-DG protein
MYVTKTKSGYSATNGNDATQAKTKSIFWGCPAWEGYPRGDPGGYSLPQTGYGMNAYPEYAARYPTKGLELGESSGVPYDNQVDIPSGSTGWTSYTNRWYKAKQWTQPAERCLVADSLFWLIEARPPLNPPQMAGQFTLNNGITGTSWAAADGTHGTMFDWYRHGKYPPLMAPDEYASKGGKVAYNVLFADFHVATQIDQATSYKIVRMKYPG